MKSATIQRIAVPATTERLVEIWQRLLGHTSFTTQDNFFDVGGHSLVANRLCASIEEEFGVTFPVLEVFDNATIDLQVSRINSARA